MDLRLAIQSLTKSCFFSFELFYEEKHRICKQFHVLSDKEMIETCYGARNYA